MFHTPKTPFTGKVYPPKPNPSNAKLFEQGSTQYRVRPCSAPTGKQQLAINATRKEMHHSTPRRCPQSGGKTRLCYINQLEEKNKSLQEELKKLENENSEMWNKICDLEDRLKEQNDQFDRQLRKVMFEKEETMNCLSEKMNVRHGDRHIPGAWSTHRHDRYRHLDYQDQEEYITSKGEKLNVNHQNMEALWEELECLRSDNDTLKREKDSLTRKIHSLQMELENSPSLEESQRLRSENNTLKRNIYSLEKKLQNQSRKHNDPYEKDRWRHLWQRKLDDKERELKKTQEENRQMKESLAQSQTYSTYEEKLHKQLRFYEKQAHVFQSDFQKKLENAQNRVNEKNRELQQTLKSKSQQYIDFQNELQLAQERYLTKEDNYKSQFKDKLEEKERQLSVLNQEMMRKNQTNTDLRKEIDTLKKKALDTEFEKNELKTRLQRQEAHNEFLNEETAKLKKNMINLQNEHESLQQDKEQYITRGEEIIKQNEIIELQKQWIESLEEQRGHLQSEQESSEEMYQKVLDDTKEEIEKLQNKVYRLERHIRETKTDEEKIKDISTEKRNLELVIQSLCKQVSEWKTGYHQIERERNKDLESKSEKELSYERQISLLKQECETIKKEKEEKEILCQKYYNLTKNLEKQQEYCDAQKTEIDGLRQDLFHLQKEKEQWQQQESHLISSTASRQKTEIERLKSKLTSETASLNSKIETLMKEKQDLEKELTSLRSSTNSQLDTKDKDLAKVKLELRLQDKMFDEKETEFKKLKSKLTSETISLKTKLESMNMLKKEKQDSDRELTTLRSRCKQLEDERKLDMKSKSEREQSSGRELLQVKQDNERLQKEKEDLVKEKARLDKKCKQLEDERKLDMKSKSEREQSSGRELLQVKQDNEKLQKEKEDLVKEKARLDKKCKQLEDERKFEMKSKSEREQSSGRKLSQLKQEIERLQIAKEDLMIEKERFDENTTSQLKKSEQELATVKSDLHLKDKLLKEKETELKNLKSEKKSETTSLNMKLESLREENQDLERKLTNLKSMYHQSEGHLMADLKKQQEDNLIKKTEILRLQEDIQQLKDTTDYWQQEKHDIMSRHHREHEEIKELLQTQKHENVSLKMEVQKLKQTIHETERECQQLQDQNQQLLLKRDSNTQEFQQLSAAAKSENEILQRKITHLQKENAKLETRNQGLNDQIQDINTRNLRQVQAEKQLKNDLEAKSRECEKYKDGLSTLKDKMERKTSSWQEEKEAYQLQSSNLERSREELNKLKLEIQSKEKIVKEWQRENEELKLKMIKDGKDFDKEKKGLLDENKELQNKLKNLNASANSEEERLRGKIKSREDKISNLEALLQQFESNSDKVQEMENRLKFREQQLASEIASLKQREEDNKQSWQQIESVMQQKEIENERSASRIHELEDRLKGMREKLGTLSKERDRLKEEKDNALTRLSALAGNRLRDNNAAIADLSDENRPISLAEKFSELYDNQWTDALEELEKVEVLEKTAIKYLLELVQVVFEECRNQSQQQTESLMKLTCMTGTDRDAMKKLKDFRKSIAGQSLKNVKKAVMDSRGMMAYRKEIPHCESYINRCIEICWFMQVQDPPVVLNFSAKPGMSFDDKVFRPFTKTGKIVDYVVWPVMLLHEGGPLLQKGVVQPK